MVELIAILCLVGLGVILIGYSRFKTHKLAKSQSYTSYSIKASALAVSDGQDLSQFYSVVAKLLDNLSRGTLLARPSVVLVANFNGDLPTSFIITAPTAIALVIKNQLLNLPSKLVITKVPTQYGIINLHTGKRYVASSWRLKSPIKTGQPNSNLVDLLATNLHGLKRSEQVVWQVILCSDKPSIFISLITYLVKISFSLIKLGWNLWIELIENDPKIAKQRALNRRVMMYSKTSINDQLGTSLRVGMRSIVVTKSSKRLVQLSRVVRTSNNLFGLDECNKLFNQSIQNYFGLVMPKSSKRMECSNLGQLFNLPLPGGRWEEKAELSFSTELVDGLGHLTKPDVVLGLGREGAVGLTKSEREKHTLIIGGTGMGKSTLLGYSLIQDMVKGHGAALIDPHGDLANQMLKFVPKNRVSDVIYIDPSQIHYPVAINLMELPHGLSEDELAIAKDFIAEAIISIFRKIFSDDDSGGHRIEYILRNAIYTAFSVRGATLLTLHKLLTNDVYRAGVLSQINNDALKNFWYGEYAKAGNYQRVKMISGVTAKLGRFESSVAIRRIIEAPHSTIDFDQVIDQQKILICNFAKGAIGEDSSSLLGMLVLAKLQLAAIRRSRKILSVASRTPFYLYVDEFELFNTPIFSQLISESRKFGVHLTLAEQTTAYQDEQASNILLANVGNLVCFRTAAEVDKRRLLPLFLPYISEFDLSNLEPFNFYLKASGERAKRPRSARTIELQGEGSFTVAEQVVRHSHQHFSYPYLSQDDSTKQLARVPMRS